MCSEKQEKPQWYWEEDDGNYVPFEDGIHLQFLIHTRSKFSN